MPSGYTEEDFPGYAYNRQNENRVLRVERALAGLKPEPKEGSLLDRKRTQMDGLLAAASLLTAEITRVAAQIKILEGFPTEDPYVDGTQIRFSRNFPGGDTVYTYGAMKANNVWYTTGKVGVNGVTWEAFINWLGLGLVGEIEVVFDPKMAKAPAKRTRARKATGSKEFLAGE